MKLSIPEEFYGNSEVLKLIAEKILTPKQFQELYKINPVIKNINLCEGQALSKWIKGEYPKMEQTLIKSIVARIFEDLRSKELIDKNKNTNYISENYGYVKRNSINFTPEGYQLIRQQYKEVFKNTNNPTPKDYNYLAHMLEYFKICPKNYIYASMNKIYRLLDSQNYTVKNDKGRKTTRKGKKYIKNVIKSDKSKEYTCLFKTDSFMQLLKEIGFSFELPVNNIDKTSSNLPGYSLTEIATKVGYKTTKNSAYDSIIKMLNLDLLSEGIIHKPEGTSRWQFQDWVLKEKPWWGYNEIKGKQIQAKFYDNEKVINEIKERINIIKSEEE